jgi:murein DD-endopeptidase MepM/ murein hydrolase activator NlpD
MDRLIEEAAIREQSFRDLIEFFKKQRSVLACVPSIWPVRGWVSSEFGIRQSPFTGRREFHKGIDIAADPGREIVAPADGIVVLNGRDPNMGLVVQLNHSQGFSTIYGHLLRSVVRKGQILRRGDVIGFIGNSGRSTGPHLHYTMLLNGVPVNPRKYLN